MPARSEFDGIDRHVEGTPMPPEPPIAPKPMPEVEPETLDKVRSAVERSLRPSRRKKAIKSDVPLVVDTILNMWQEEGESFMMALDEGRNFYSPYGQSFLIGAVTIRTAIHTTNPDTPPIRGDLTIDWRSPTTSPDEYQKENPAIMDAIRGTDKLDRQGSAFRAGAMCMYEAIRMTLMHPTE